MIAVEGNASVCQVKPTSRITYNVVCSSVCSRLLRRFEAHIIDTLLLFNDFVIARNSVSIGQHRK